MELREVPWKCPGGCKGSMDQWEERKQKMQRERDARAQGLVEYAMIILLVALIVILVLVLLAPPIANVYSNIITNL